MRDFFILFRSWVINKIVKNECIETTSFLIFANNSISKQNKKIPEHPFVDIDEWEMLAKFQQKVLNPTVVRARQSFIFFRQNTWFLENNGALSRFLYGILHNLISIIKLLKISFLKPNFILTTRATLNKQFDLLRWLACLKKKIIFLWTDFIIIW